jgi:hypothetical protein
MATAKEIQAVWDIVNKEWRQFCNAADLFQKLTGQEPKGTKTALFDSITLHMRNLVEFFLTAARFPTDPSAWDYFASESDKAKWKSEMGSWPDLLKYRKEAHEQVSHISTARLLPDADAWKVALPGMVTHLGEVISKFERFTTSQSPPFKPDRIAPKIGDRIDLASS